MSTICVPRPDEHPVTGMRDTLETLHCHTFNRVVNVKDNENKFDMLVRNCVAHNGKKNPIQLVDEIGCITRPKIMSRFQKIKNFGESATVVSYAYFQAFKFPDSMNVHFQCVIQGPNSIEKHLA